MLESNRHPNQALAEEVAKAGAIEHLSNCVQDPETSLKKVAAVALCEIGKHNAELANAIASHPGTLKAITAAFKDRDMELRQNACICLANLAKHNEEIAQKVGNADLFPAIIDYCLKEEKPGLQRQAMQCIKEIAGQSAELAKMVGDPKYIDPIINYLSKAKGAGKLPAIMTLGFVAGFDKEMAKTVVQLKGHIALMDSLEHDKETHIKAAAAWSLGQIVKHSAELGSGLNDQKVMNALLKAYLYAEEKGDLQNKARRALRTMIQQCQEMSALAPLLGSAPVKILKHVVAQIGNLLKNKKELLLLFAKEGHLGKLQEIQAPAESKLQASIVEINKLYSDDVVHYFTKGHLDTLIKQKEDYEHHE